MKVFVVNGKSEKRGKHVIPGNSVEWGWVIQVKIHPVIVRRKSEGTHNPPPEAGQAGKKPRNPSGDPAVGNNADIVPFPGSMVSR